MYSTLNYYGQSSSAVSTRYPCTSLAIPSNDISVNQDMIIPPPPILKRTVHVEPPSHTDDVFLLPVMDPSFNLREICKQCVLLEDHLTHDDKRCTDCCTKHFLTLEALAEEALTLDRDGKLRDDARQLPKKIRQLQIFWMENPDKCHEISQKLREIRKLYQEESFGIIRQGCKDSACKVK
jgi:hypothetical protein